MSKQDQWAQWLAERGVTLAQRAPRVETRQGFEVERLKAEALDDPARFAEWPLRLMVPPHHREWYRLSQLYKVDPRFSKLLIQAPTGWGKTTAMNLALPLYEIVKDRSIQIGMVGNNLLNVQQKLRAATVQMLENKDLINGFGYVEPEDGTPRFRPKGKREVKWTVNEIVVAGATEEAARRGKLMADPNLVVFGWEGKMEGRHWDLYIGDDVVDYVEAQSAIVRESQLDWYLNVMRRRMNPGGREIWIGTPAHQGDLYQYIIESGEYVVIDEPQALVRDSEGNEVSSWPDVWPTEALLKEREDNEVSFLLKRMCKIAGKGLTDFPNDAVQACRDENLCYYGNRQNLPQWLKEKNLWVYVGVDLATGFTDQSKYFSLYVEGVDRNTADRYLLHLVRGQKRTSDQKQDVRDAYAAWDPVEIVVENNGTQAYFYEDSFEGLPVRPVNTGSNKVDLGEGIPTLVALTKAKRLHIPWGDAHAQSVSAPFVKELKDFPKGKSTDMIMAWWFTERRARLLFLAPPKVQENRNFFRRHPRLIVPRSAGGFYHGGPIGRHH